MPDAGRRQEAAHLLRDRSGVSTPIESYAVSTALMRMPCSSARSCSSDSARSSGVGSSVGQHQQRAAAIGVQADVAIERRPPARGIAHVRDRGAREIQREPAAVDDDLDDVRVVELRALRDPPVERRHRNGRDRRERRDRLVDRPGIDQRLVALHVDDDVAVERRGDFREPIGAGLVRRLRQPHLPAEFVDAPSRCAGRRWPRSRARPWRRRRRGGRRVRSSAGRRCRRAACRGTV